VRASGGLLDEAMGPSFAPPRGCGGGSVKNKVVLILTDMPGAILPRMRRSFVDRQYSPSIGIDQSN
jgi:hypothetical protein